MTSVELLRAFMRNSSCTYQCNILYCIIRCKVKAPDPAHHCTQNLSNARKAAPNVQTFDLSSRLDRHDDRREASPTELHRDRLGEAENRRNHGHRWGADAAPQPEGQTVLMLSFTRDRNDGRSICHS